jgi:iron complex transport system permease protein
VSAVLAIRTRSVWIFFTVVCGLLAIAFVAGISVGSTHIPWETVARVIGGRLLPEGWVDMSGITEAEHVIIWMIRMPRVIVAGLAGAALAIAGTQMQGMFRNPLADPNIVGVSAGAALGAVFSFVVGLSAASALWLPLCAFVGALGALATVYAITARAGRTPVATLLLAGIALSALLGSVTTLLVSLSFVDWQVSAQIVFWLMGGLDSRTWTHVWISLPFVALGTLTAIWFTRDLDLMLLGEETSASLGVEVETVKIIVLTTAALLTGAAVAVSGVIGFVGLVVPHAIRLVLGPSHRVLVPASVVMGALFLICCDLLARTIHPPTEIRLGVVTAAFGAPFFLYLLRKRGKDLGYF